MWICVSERDESYWDRKLGTKVGVYQGKVRDQYSPYIRPQENGNEIDVRCVSLTKDQGVGILVVGDSLINVSTHRFTDSDFDPGQRKKCRHT